MVNYEQSQKTIPRVRASWATELLGKAGQKRNHDVP